MSGDIGDPELIGTFQYYLRDKIRIDPVAMLGVCRLNPALLPTAG